MNKILVPIDGSAASVMAEETAATIAKKTGASVTVLHVMPEMRIGYRLPINIQDELLGSVQQRADSIINSARALFVEEKVKVETEIFSGDLANSILEFSKEYYDLLVIGAHGENEKDPYALGSVTKKVIMYAVCPTLIVKKLSPLSNLLACVDGSKNSIKALKYALGLAEKLCAKVTLLNVQDQKLYKASPKTARELGDKILSRSLVEAGKTKIKIDKRLEFGVPSDKIVEVAEQGNYDLIILGSRGLGTIRRFLLGSISDDVSHKAKCSVLIIPAKA